MARFCLAIASNYQCSCVRKPEGGEHKWVRPEPKFIKLNVDAAYHEDEGAGATSEVLTDGHGNLLVAQCVYVPYAANVVTVEAMAMRDGLALPRVEAESDYTIVVDACVGHTT